MVFFFGVVVVFVGVVVVVEQKKVLFMAEKEVLRLHVRLVSPAHLSKQSIFPYLPISPSLSHTPYHIAHITTQPITP